MERSPLPEDSTDLDRSRKRAIVEAPTALDRCRLMVKAALGDPSQIGGKDDGKTQALRGEHQVRQGLTEAVFRLVTSGGVQGAIGKRRRTGEAPHEVFIGTLVVYSGLVGDGYRDRRGVLG